jgi:hypothetical protein
MAPTCINASSHTRNTLNQLKSSASSHIRNALNQLKSSASSHTRNALNQLESSASSHTRNALSQLKSSVLQIKCAQIHLNDSNQDLQCWNVHTYTSMIQIKTYNVGMCTHAHLMLQNTSKEHQSRTCAPPSSKWLAKPQSSSRAPKAPPKPPKRANLHLEYTQILKISLNAHKQSDL